MLPRIHKRRGVLLVLVGCLLLFGFAALTLQPNSGVSSTLQQAAVSDGENSTTTEAFLEDEEIVLIVTESEQSEQEMLPVEKVQFRYAEVLTSCDHNYQHGECVKVYAGPGTDYEEVQRLRKGMVLKVNGQVTREGEAWYKITLTDQWLRYPERIEHDWYVRASKVHILHKPGTKTSWEDGVATNTNKRIVIDRTHQVLTAYEGEEVYMQTAISTGVALSPTPLGTYTVFKKMPSRYMQGPIEGLEGSDYYDLPGVPWNLYFTEGGAVIHGAYWHESFGSAYSHGCVNLPPVEAQALYNWAVLGTTVEVVE